MGNFAQLLLTTTQNRLSVQQIAIIQVLTADELRPLEAVILRTLITPERPPPLLADGWHAPYAPLPGPSL